MTKKRFLTVGWNNILTLTLGIPAVVYVIFAFSTSLWTEMGGMIGLSIIGVLYWLVLEGHTSMRFAWLRENSPNDLFVTQAFVHPLALIRKFYNTVFWIFLLPFFTIIDYRTGFIAFTVIIAIRLGLNLYTNNLLDLTPQQYERYPFRIPWMDEIRFITTQGGERRDRGINLLQTDDGGYAIVGYTSSGGAIGEDVFLVRTDQSGEVIWNQTFGGVSEDTDYTVRQTSDEGFILAGETYRFGEGGGDMYIIKVNQEGEIAE